MLFEFLSGDEIKEMIIKTLDSLLLTSEDEELKYAIVDALAGLLENEEVSEGLKSLIVDILVDVVQMSWIPGPERATSNRLVMPSVELKLRILNALSSALKSDVLDLDPIHQGIHCQWRAFKYRHTGDILYGFR